MGPGRKDIEAQVSAMAEPIAAALGLELVDLEYVKERDGYYLRVFIDKAQGVTLDDCQAMSESLEARIDEADPIPGSYSLEVSSPGLDRPLKKPTDFERFVGRRVKLKAYAPLGGRKNWTGTLIRFENEVVWVLVDGEEHAVPLDMIARANLVPEYGQMPVTGGK